MALVGFAVAGFTAVDVLGQAPVTLPVPFAEFRLAGTWALECARPYVALTLESGVSAQLVMRREKDGVRFDIRSAAKLSDDLVSLDLRPISVLNDGKWRAPSAAETNPVCSSSSASAATTVRQSTAAKLFTTTSSTSAVGVKGHGLDRHALRAAFFFSAVRKSDRPLSLSMQMHGDRTRDGHELLLRDHTEAGMRRCRCHSMATEIREG